MLRVGVGSGGDADDDGDGVPMQTKDKSPRKFKLTKNYA